MKKINKRSWENFWEKLCKNVDKESRFLAQQVQNSKFLRYNPKSYKNSPKS